jgi:hypothetical protein
MVHVTFLVYVYSVFGLLGVILLHIVVVMLAEAFPIRLMGAVKHGSK